MTLVQELLGKDDALKGSSHVELHDERLAAAGGLEGNPFDWGRRWPCRPYSAEQQNHQVDRGEHAVLQKRRNVDCSVLIGLETQ